MLVQSDGLKARGRKARLMSVIFEEAADGAAADVQLGMPVFDTDGVLLGSVEDLSMGDAGAVTTASTAAGDTRPRGGMLRGIAAALVGELSEPLVPEPVRRRLLRTGYIKLATPGVLHHGRYIRADRVARVIDGRVELSVPEARLRVED